MFYYLILLFLIGEFCSSSLCANIYKNKPDSLPEFVDWRNVTNRVTTVKDQSKFIIYFK